MRSIRCLLNQKYEAEELVQKDFYANDYANSTMKLISDNVLYETAKQNYIDLVRRILR